MQIDFLTMQVFKCPPPIPLGETSGTKRAKNKTLRTNLWRVINLRRL